MCALARMGACALCEDLVSAREAAEVGAVGVVEVEGLGRRGSEASVEMEQSGGLGRRKAREAGG